jgi:hypothetical protein
MQQLPQPLRTHAIEKPVQRIAHVQRLEICR